MTSALSVTIPPWMLDFAFLGMLLVVAFMLRHLLTMHTMKDAAQRQMERERDLERRLARADAIAEDYAEKDRVRRELRDRVRGGPGVDR